MASKGKLWKLWFRRDASWNLNFSPLSMPECIYISFNSTIFSARYAVSQIKQVMAVNLSKEYVRKWTSPTYGGTFDNVYWTFEIEGQPNENPTGLKFAIWHEAVIDTPLYSATYFLPDEFFEWYSWQLLGVKTLHFLSPDITVDPYPLRLAIQAARYDRYNP